MLTPRTAGTGTFTLAQPSLSVSVELPPGQDVFDTADSADVGNVMTVTWNASHAVGNYVSIKLYALPAHGGSPVFVASMSQSQSSQTSGNSFSWTVPASSTTGLAELLGPFSVFSVVVADVNDATKDGYSAPFAIDRPRVRVTSPAAGELVYGLDDFVVRWDSRSLMGYVNVFLRYSNGTGADVLNKAICSNVLAKTTNCTWSVPASGGVDPLQPGLGVSNTTRFSVFVTSQTTTWMNATSPDFTLMPAPITVARPVGVLTERNSTFAWSGRGRSRCRAPRT